MSLQPTLHQIGRSGEVRLQFDRQADKTVLAGQYSHPPLQIMRAIPDAAGCLCVYLLSPTGGIVQHDRYQIDIVVGDQAHALFTTQSATKIYRMPDGCAEQVTRVDIGRGALFEYLPDAAILFADADYHQRMDVFLHSGALALLTDVIMPGRLARGERLQFRRFANRLIVRDEAGLLIHDASTLEPAHHHYDAYGRLDGYPCWGSAYIVGDTAAWRLDIGALVSALQPHVDAIMPSDGIGGVSPLYRGGLCVRVLSHRLETIYSVFGRVRDTMRTALGIAVEPLRK